MGMCSYNTQAMLKPMLIWSASLSSLHLPQVYSRQSTTVRP